MRSVSLTGSRQPADGDRPGRQAAAARVGELTGGDSIPKIFSHEIAEALSDPDLGSGIIVNGSDEIGDVCNNTWSSVNGHAEEAYWSQADRRCVIPVWQARPAVAGNPVLIQGRFGSPGNFEMVVPAAAGGWRITGGTTPRRACPGMGRSRSGRVSGGGCGDNDPEQLRDPGEPGGHRPGRRALQFFWRIPGRPSTGTAHTSCSPRPGRGRLSEHRQARIANTFTQL